MREVFDKQPSLCMSLKLIFLHMHFFKGYMIGLCVLEYILGTKVN